MRPHGTVTRYSHGPDETGQRRRGCRCNPCRGAMTTAQRARRRALAYGRHEPGYGPLETTRAHLARLTRAGLSLYDVSVATAGDASYQTVWQISCGRRTRITARVSAAILAVPLTARGARLTPTLGAQRRIRALARLGYPLAEQARRFAIPYHTLEAAASRQYPTWRVTFDDRLRAGYDRLAFAPLPAGWIAERCRNRAIAAGWPSPAAWWDGDEDWIDDPTRGPDGLHDPDRTGRRTATDVDAIAVQAVIDGDLPWRSLIGPANRREVVARLIAAGTPGRTIRHRFRLSGATYARLTATPPPAEATPAGDETPEREAA